MTLRGKWREIMGIADCLVGKLSFLLVKNRKSNKCHNVFRFVTSLDLGQQRNIQKAKLILDRRVNVGIVFRICAIYLVLEQRP